MTDAGMLLRALRHGDSSFPSGAASFSWGLETLYRDGHVLTHEALEEFLAEQLRRRWASSDRAALVSAWRCAGDLVAVTQCDRMVESQSLASELRSGSRRCGRAMLSMHVRLGTPCADEYAKLVRSGAVPGHLAVVQGMLWRNAGLPLAACEVMSAWSMCWSVASAAVRLSLATHVDAQCLQARMEPVIEELLRQPAIAVEQMHGFTPAAEIAAMRHEQSDTRLFSN